MNSRSFLAVILLAIVFAAVRIAYIYQNFPEDTQVLTWDAFGYYIYLPGQYIYHDITKLTWLPHILEQYHPTPHLYQTIALPNGNFAMKYLMGLSILYTPFFWLGHFLAGILGYEQDGFTTPYQWSICFGAWVYAIIGLMFLRKVLLRFFSDQVSMVTLILIGFASNYLQYVAIDTAQTHGFLFGLYAFFLWLVVKWHEKRKLSFAFGIGICAGLGAITRPTEAIMMFLPLLWIMNEGTESVSKFAFFKRNPIQLYAALVGGFMGILPQIVYWKYVTGNWVFDVGSKFLFLNPYFRVLFGWEKGWFIYTPVTILMIAGMFFMRNFPFRKSVTTFVIVNTWIIIAWSDWTYGATYSCRALVQSYPVLALPLAIMVQKMLESRSKWIFYGLFAFLIGLNLFQIWQYNRTILHYRDMNRPYYAAIFMNPNPSPLQMSLLDTDEMIRDASRYQLLETVFQLDSVVQISTNGGSERVFWENQINTSAVKDHWLRLTMQVKSDNGAYDTYLVTKLTKGGETKRKACRLENGICKKKVWNEIAYDVKIPNNFDASTLRISIEGKGSTQIEVRNLVVTMVLGL